MRGSYKKNYIDEAALAATKNGDTIDIRHQMGLSAQIIWTATTATFSVKLQTSNDGENWVDETTTQAIADNNGSTVLQWAPLYKAFARIVAARTSGTVTTLKVHICGKDS
jgi:hypothetical protein